MGAFIKGFTFGVVTKTFNVTLCSKQIHQILSLLVPQPSNWLQFLQDQLQTLHLMVFKMDVKF
jgi:hypothetical protein